MRGLNLVLPQPQQTKTCLNKNINSIYLPSYSVYLHSKSLEIVPICSFNVHTFLGTYVYK